MGKLMGKLDRIKAAFLSPEPRGDTWLASILWVLTILAEEILYLISGFLLLLLVPVIILASMIRSVIRSIPRNRPSTKH